MTGSNTWLLDYAENIVSHDGEDGIIRKIFEIIPDIDKWCVEFGAYDGKFLSNTYNLIENQEYSAVLIESDQTRFNILIDSYKNNGRVIPLNKMVGFAQDNNLDSILKNTPIPENFDFLSIDIDGNDYHVWDAVKNYKPKVVCIEYNPTIPNEVEFIQPKDMNVSQGNSILSLTKLGESKGYKLIAITGCNALYVDEKYFNLFNISDNSIQALRCSSKFITHIFSGFDGTIFLRGHSGLPWHDILLSESKVQQLPKILRKCPNFYNKFQVFLFLKYQQLLKKNFFR
ncbi:MAG: hypothetical protein A2X64_07675 [Ignavibacteria bacterium GWF2_33_9]|nr:MAG: hypothetical protein A2X64_07675 [Ignavibacteria bacterium GWF2_33_9]